MKHLRRSIELSLANGNAYGALAIALSVPDICGWLASPSVGSKARYIAWFDEYMGRNYIHFVDPSRERTVFLNGADCYALRCAFLHEGREDISEQRARQLLDSFQIIVAPKGWVVHCNLHGNTLQLQLDIFCRQFSDALVEFEMRTANDVEVQNRAASMLRIRDINGNAVG